MKSQDQLHNNKKLGEWHSTAICGNDIASSCLYVSALSLLWAGPMAPICLIAVAGVLWLFRSIYGEVVGALPLNGGAYNALLNTTSKFKASLAACLTILSYLATAVISASEASHYGTALLTNLFGTQITHSHIVIATVTILWIFAALTIRGIGESANVALVVFVFHLLTLSSLILLGSIKVWQNGLDVFIANLNSPPPNISSFPIFFGFAAAMLGVSGFESSANFVEEQEDGVFQKTLRNMWLIVTFFNPVICVLALALVPLTEVRDNQEALLAHMGQLSSGNTLSALISLDAALVLAGAVLTSFVGVTGLVHRMTLDRCLPQFFLSKSRYGTYYLIIGTFFILTSLLVILAPNVATLAGVYTISFLAVMALFVVGNVLLKVKRNRMPRTVQASWLALFIAFLTVIAGIVGKIIVDSDSVGIFCIYFLPTVLVVVVMLWRIPILKTAIYAVRLINANIRALSDSLTRRMEKTIDQINAQSIVYFTRGDNLPLLNEAMMYVKQNEATDKIKVVTVVNDPSEIAPNLKTDLEFLDKVYPEIHIEFVVQIGKFCPKLLRELSEKWQIPLNFMFIGSPGAHFSHRLAELGGVRVII